MESGVAEGIRDGGFAISRRTLVCLAVPALAHLGLLNMAGAQTTAAKTHVLAVESFGDGANAQALRERVIERLKGSKSVEVVADAARADATLKGTASVWTTGSFAIDPHSTSHRLTNYQGYLSVELVDKSNQPLWSYLATPSRFRSAGITGDLAGQVAGRLLAVLHSGTAAGTASPNAGAHVALHAAGATLPAPLYRRWFETSGIPVTYDAVGSESGIQQLGAGGVDFAATDMPLIGDQTAGAVRVLQVPTVAGGVVPIYNLPEGNGALQLTPQVLAGIYTGTIRKWNDAKIREINHGIHLPEAEIVVVHRADGSGTTFVWTSFLSLVSPEWKQKVGAGSHVNWPAGTGANGNEGVAEQVSKTPNSIGYVELIYAIQHELTYAAVQNPAGLFIRAGLESITAAAAEASSDAGLRLSILNSTRRDAYPISTFTWLLAPQSGLDAAKKKAISDLLTWMLTTGQKQCASLGYAPLPKAVTTKALNAVEGWKQTKP